jgi:hypothetical protein
MTGLPADVRSSMERVLLKTVHRLVHMPTLELRAAVEADDGDLVNVLAGLFDATPSPSGQAADRGGLLTGELDTTARPCHPPLEAKRWKMRATEQAGHECGVHGAHEFTM